MLFFYFLSVPLAKMLKSLKLPPRLNKNFSSASDYGYIYNFRMLYSIKALFLLAKD